MCSNISISVKNVSKCFEMYDNPRARLKQFILPTLRRLARREQKKYYNEFWALNDVSFEVNKGETIGIVGRNGSGKSTILQIICGTLFPTHGSVETKGRISALLELGAGFTPDFTGRENIYTNSAVLGMSKEEVDAKLDAIMSFADIGDFIDQPVRIYSSGMYVRLAFSVAIHCDPEILIVDEALAVGDERFQRKCYSKIEELKKNGVTILFVSHSGATVIELCDRAILLDQSRLHLVSDAKSVVTFYQKLLYAPHEKLAKLYQDIEDFSKGINISTPSEAKPIKTQSDEFFDPNLIPASTISYEEQGARIHSPRILNAKGEQVNILEQGQRYTYTYSVDFSRAATNVRFGMLIKTRSGLELGGALTSKLMADSIPYIESNQSRNIFFDFTCWLNPGTYFLNCGVLGCSTGDDTFIHRIIDIVMFRVVSCQGDLHTAIIAFNIESHIEV